MSEARRELLNVIARLEVVSHVPSGHGAGGFSASTDEAKGGRRPSGGIDRKDDRAEDFALKSADHFRRQLERAHTDGRIWQLVREAEAAVRAWTHTPIVEDPEYGTSTWKRWVVESKESNADLARRFNCSREYIRQVRSQEGIIRYPSRRDAAA